ncbi:MAG: hypothetical protein H6825_15030 [Planctomycetes bacterium]|nr:hypothetical protein [Planctomycetota bacterium]
MARVGTCKDCGARFKVPDSTTASRAKCAKCGGVVEIPAAEGAAPAASGTPKAPPARPAAPKAAAARTAPAKPGTKAPVRATGAAKAAVKAPAKAAAGAPSRRGKTAEGASGARPGGRRASGGSRKGARAKGGDTEKKGAPVGLIVGIVLVIVIGGAAAWYFTQDDAPPATPPSEPTTSSATDEAADTATGSETPETDQAKAPAPADEPAKAPAPIEKATPPAAQATGGSTVPDEPLPTKIEFEAFPPVVGTTQDQLDEWTALLKELYLDDGGALGRTRKKLQDREEAEIDAIDGIPAYLNAVNGIDFADTESVKGAYSLIAHWQDRVANTPTFYFDGDVSRMETEDQNKRVMAVRNWTDWWKGLRKSGQDKANLDDYRQKVEEKRAAKEDG